MAYTDSMAGFHNYGRYLLKKCEQNPEAIFAINEADNASMSFSDFCFNVKLCSTFLLKSGAGYLDVIGILVDDPILDTIIATASLCNGSIFCSWNKHHLSKDIIKMITKVTSPKVIIATRNIIDRFQHLKELSNVVVINKDYYSRKNVTNYKVRFIQGDPVESRETPGYLLLTAGITGNIKGALFSHNHILKMVETLPFTKEPGNKFTWFYDMSKPIGVFAGFFCVENGQTRIEIKFAKDDLHQVHQINTLMIDPSIIDELYAIQNKIKEMNVSNVYIGGDVIHEAMAEKLKSLFEGAKIFECYGMAEVANFVAVKNCSDQKGFEITDECELKILDWVSNTPMDNGEDGQIMVKSPHMMLEYIDDSRENFTVIKQDGWMQTGDEGSIGKDGRLSFKKKKKAISKGIKNVQILHEVVERGWLKINQMKIALAKSYEKWIIFVETKEESNIDKEILNAYLKEYEIVPGQIVKIEKIPIFSDRIDREGLQQIIMKLNMSSGY